MGQLTTQEQTAVMEILAWAKVDRFNEMELLELQIHLVESMIASREVV
jgi:hypothetical protein